MELGCEDLVGFLGYFCEVLFCLGKGCCVGLEDLEDLGRMGLGLGLELVAFLLECF